MIENLAGKYILLRMAGDVQLSKPIRELDLRINIIYCVCRRVLLFIDFQKVQIDVNITRVT